jgi:hypothetical protein
MGSHTPKWTLILGVGILMSFRNFRKRFHESKFIGLKSSLYYWKVFNMQMSKMVSHYSFKYLKHKLWSKEGPRVKLSIVVSRALKVNNCLDLLVCKWCVTYLWKALNWGYNFSLDPISIKGLHKKLWTSKVQGVLISRILRLPTWKSQNKIIFECNPCGQS